MYQCCRTVTTNRAVFKNEGISDLVNLNTEKYRLDIDNIEVEMFHLHSALLNCNRHSDMTEYRNRRACAES